MLDEPVHPRGFEGAPAGGLVLASQNMGFGELGTLAEIDIGIAKRLLELLGEVSRSSMESGKRPPLNAITVYDLSR